MATIYCDFEAGSDGNNGSTWALAKLTLQAAITAAGAGGDVYVRRTNAGTPTKDSAGTRSITFPANTLGNPVMVYGCADGTTAEPPTSADFETTVANQPELECTASETLTIGTSDTHVQFNFMRIVALYRLTWSGGGCRITVANGYIEVSDNFQLGSAMVLETINTNVDFTAGGIILPRSGGTWTAIGGTFTWSATSPVTINTTSLQYFFIDWRGVDLFDFAGATAIWDLQDNEGIVKMLNCRIPNLALAVNVPNGHGYLEAIGCTHNTATANASIQDYYRYDVHGITANSTESRTGGADDQSTGGYSLSLTPHDNSTREGSEASVVTPWFSVWVDAGALNVTAYLTNNSAEINLDDAWLELLTPNSVDTADHDLTFDGGVARLIASTTGIATDTSVWTLASDFPQKLVASVTAGYTGWAYGRVHYAKRGTSVPPLYVDPRLIAA